MPITNTSLAPNGYSLLVVGVPQCHSRGHCRGEHCANCVQPPKTPTCTSSPPAPTLTPYTLDRIQPTRPDSPHISPSHKLTYVATPTTPTPAPHIPTPPHSHTRNKQKTSKTKHEEIMQRNHNKLIHQHAHKISPSELSLPRETRRTLAQPIKVPS